MGHSAVSRLSLASLAALLLALPACSGKDGDAGTKQTDQSKKASTSDKAAGDKPAGDKPAGDKPAGDQVKAKAAGEPVRLVVYSGRGAVNVEPVFAKFTEATGIQIDARFGEGTQSLAEQLATEKDQTACDVFFAQDSGHLGALGKAGLFQALPDGVLSQVGETYRSPDKSWVGTSGRARVLVYNPEKIKPADLPDSLENLADPRWKGRLGWAPTNGSFQAHVSALRHIWGEEKTKTWLGKMKAMEPARYPKNSPQVKAVSKGEIDIGWVNHYYLHKLKSADPTLKAANYSFIKGGDAGNLMMVAGVGITAATKKKEAALKLVEFLIGEEAQNHFAQKVFEYPARPGVAHHPGVPAIDDRLVQVDQTHLIDLGATLALLRELGLN